jgi:hypothetical protein
MYPRAGRANRVSSKCHSFALRNWMRCSRQNDKSIQAELQPTNSDKSLLQHLIYNKLLSFNFGLLTNADPVKRTA